MKKVGPGTSVSLLRDIVAISSAIIIHLWYLTRTTFVDWPEMLVYPWFLTKHLLYYRDVVLAYVPGAYYLLYSLYSMLGFTAEAERAIAYAFIFFTDCLVYVAVRKLTDSRLWAAVATAFFVLWQPVFYGNTIWYETILAPVYLIGLITMMYYLEKPDMRRAVAVGIVLAAASLIKQTAAWSVAVVCLYVWLSDRNKREGFVRAVVIGMLPVAANLAVWGYFAIMGAGREFGYWSYGFLFALSHATSRYMLPPTRGDIAYILPAFVPLILLAVSFRKDKAVRLMAVWTAALIMAGLPRWGVHRLQPALAFASVAFGVALPLFWHIRRKAAVVLMALSLLILAGTWRSFRLFVGTRDAMQPQFFGKEYRSLLDYARNSVGGPFFVVGNYDYLYFGLDREPAVLPWVPLFPWNAEVPGVQAQLVRALEAEQVPYVFYLPYHGTRGYYDDYAPRELLLYLSDKYEKIAPLPAPGGILYARK